jgi:hypothetical protein
MALSASTAILLKIGSKGFSSKDRKRVGCLIMRIKLNNRELVSFDELLMSQVVQQEAFTRLLVEKGIFTKEEFLEMVRVVDQERKKKAK